MANWDTHILTFIGPMDAIQQCAKDLAIQAGRLNNKNELMSEYGGRPAIAIGPGRYYARTCWVGVCDIEVELEAVGFSWALELYRELRIKYPTLHIMWRYWLDMDWGVGYLDDAGDHIWHEETEGHFVAGPWPMPSANDDSTADDDAMPSADGDLEDL